MGNSQRPTRPNFVGFGAYRRTFPHSSYGCARPSTSAACTLERSKVMPTCKSCGDEAEELIAVKVAGKTKKLCESCADEVREQGEVAEASEAVVQNMMGFKGRR